MDKEHKQLFQFYDKALSIGAGTAALYWVIEVFLDSLLFDEGTILQRVFPSDLNELWMRSLVVALLLLFGGYVQINHRRNRAEEKMREAEVLFSDLLYISKDGIIMIDEEHRIVLFNHGAEDIFGYPASETVGMPLDLLIPERFSVKHDKDIDSFGGGDVSTRQMGKSSRDLFGRRKNGEEFPADISISKLTEKGKTLFSAVIRDVTERKRAEDAIKKLNQELEQRVVERTEQLAERTKQLEATNKDLEAFCYSVSHDLRSPLRGITGFSQALMEDAADTLNEKEKEHLERICNAGIRMGKLIDSQLTLYRVTRRKMRIEPVDLSALCHYIASELERNQPERMVKWHIADGMAAEGDPGLIQALLQNLLENAWKFTEKNPEAQIEFGTMDYGKKPAYFVRDNGAGFDMAYADNLFKPFKRLHRLTEFAGTGIGLATAQRIIHRHGGEIWAKGKVGKGATVYFCI